jgi:hypothetical protein
MREDILAVMEEAYPVHDVKLIKVSDGYSEVIYKYSRQINEYLVKCYKS